MAYSTQTQARETDGETTALATRSTEVESWMRAVAQLTDGWHEPSVPLLEPGARLCRGRFVIGAMLGRGGMGVVYDVHDRERRADLALKTLIDTRSERLLAFKHEFRSLQDLGHPNLVRLDELFEDRGRWFFTMERIQGVPFIDFVRPRRLDEPRLRRSLEQLARGLLALHRADRVHRDIKPSNTLVEANGRVVLLDFGLISDARRTGEALLPGAGTAAYMAPEQVAGGGGRAADWYSVGVMLYQALTGALPFDGDARTIIDRKLVETPRPPSELAPGVPHDLERLCLDLLQREPRWRPDGGEVLMRLAGVAGARDRPAPEPGARLFVGRAGELDRLRRALARVERRGATAVFITGESGVGKTALLEAFLAELRPPITVLAGRCYEREFVPFKALDGLIDALARHLDHLEDAALQVLPPSCADLARVFPVLGRACRRAGLASTFAEPASPTAARAGAFRSLRQLLAGLARTGRVVLAIDDLHWADVDSVSAIEDLLQGAVAPNLLFILVARTGTRSPRISCERVDVELGPLPADEAEALARRLLAETPGTNGATLTWLAEEGRRHPLFIEAILRHGPFTGGVAARLEDALAARVASLPAEARTLIEVASVAVQPLSAAELRSAAGIAAEPLFRLIRDLQADRLVLSRRVANTLSIEPYHDQVRRAVIGCMTPDRQLACHRSIAETLERLAPGKSDPLAVHWRAAGEIERARRHAIRAGHHARRVLAFDRAATYYQMALDLCSNPAERTAEIYRWLAESLADAGRPTESAAAYEAAAKRAAGDDKSDLHRCAADQMLRGGHFAEGLTIMDRILAELGMARPRGVVAAVRMIGKERLLEWLDRLVGWIVPYSARRRRTLARRADACWTTALGLAGFDPVTAAVFQSRYVRISRRLRDPVRLALGLCARAPEGAFAGAPARRAYRALAKARQIMRGRNDPLVDGYHSLATGIVALLQGRFPESLEHSERAITSFRSHSGPTTWEVGNAQRCVLDCLWHTGRIRILRERTSSAWREATRRGDRFLTMQIETTVLPIVHLTDDDADAARAVLDQALAHWPRAGVSLLHWQQGQTRTLVELYAGEPARALAIMEAELAALEHAVFSRLRIVFICSLFLHATALLGVAARQPADAAALLQRAERDVRRLEATRMAADIVALLRGQIALLRGDPTAAGHFATAERLLAERGMRLLGLVAAYGTGMALGGQVARVQAERTWQLLQAEEIRSPAGFIRLFAPVVDTLGADPPTCGVRKCPGGRPDIV